MAKGTLTVRLVGDKKPLDKTLGEVGKSLGGFVAKVGVAATAAAGVVAAKSLTAFAGFESSMNEVFTLLPGISADAMNAMEGQVKDFSKEFGVLPDKVVPSLYQALSAGVPKDNVFEFLETAQQAAKGGVTDLTTAVDGISSVVNAYGDQISGAAEASDLMFTAVRLGKTNFEELSASLSNVTPIASGLGVKFDDVSAALAAITAKGTPTAQATTQLRSLFVELSKAGGATAATFEKIAGKSFQEFIAEGGNTAEALDLMKQAADESGVQLQDLFGSVEAGGAALSLASDSTFADNIEEMGAAAGATQGAFDQMNTGIAPVIDKIKAFSNVVLIEIGEKVADVFNVLAAWWAGNGPQIVSRVQEIASAIGGRMQEIGAAISGFVSGALATLSDWWGTNGPLIIDAMNRIAGVVQDTLVAAFGTLSDWWSENGSTITSAAETMSDGVGKAFDKIADAVEFVQENWDKFKVAIGVAVAIMIPHFVALATAAVISSVKQVVAWVATNAAAIGAAVVHSAQVALMVAKWVFVGAQSLFHAAKVAAAWLIAMGPIGLVIAAVVGLVALIIANWDTIKRVTADLWNKVKEWTSAAWDAVKNGISAALTFVKNLFLNFTGPGLIIKHWDTIKRVTSETWDKIKGAVSGALDKVVGFVTGMPRRIATAASGMWDGLKDAFRGAINWIIDKWNNLSFTLPGVTVPGLGQVGGFTLSTPNIPRLEQGGEVLQTGLAVVHKGERFSGTRNEFPIGQPGGGDTYITVNMPNYVGDKREMMQVIKAELAKDARRGGKLIANVVAQ